MKKRVFIGASILLIIAILIFILIYLKKNVDTGLRGTYQTNIPGPTVQFVIDGDKYTEYVDSKVTDSGTISKSQENAYLLDDGKQKMFLYKDGKNIFYYNPDLGEEVQSLEKIFDVPTYTTSN